MVAPKGRVKLVILFDTPTRFCIQSIVRGRVADEEAVEKGAKLEASSA